jgi:hypothetical protein
MAEQENHHGWAPDVAGDDPTAAQAADKARAASGSEPGGAPGDYSPEGTLSSTDTEPGSPHGAGDSRGKGAEEIAADDGREAEGHKGASQRPYGSTDDTGSTGVDPQEPRDPNSPSMPA